LLLEAGLPGRGLGAGTDKKSEKDKERLPHEESLSEKG
jgi:hypothetical protein